MKVNFNSTTVCFLLLTLAFFGVGGVLTLHLDHTAGPFEVVEGSIQSIELVEVPDMENTESMYKPYYWSIDVQYKYKVSSKEYVSEKFWLVERPPISYDYKGQIPPPDHYQMIVDDYKANKLVNVYHKVDDHQSAYLDIQTPDELPMVKDILLAIGAFFFLITLYLFFRKVKVATRD
ncbi:MAG: hypothetical protein HRU06_09020 [Oceanospirillaceae bacterium]|nr:hypothetical protein [Oceanospirillaceae bacterium]